MAEHTAIEWTDATWNPVTGCSVVSPGCTNCYAMKLAGTRLRLHPSRAGLTAMGKAGPVWTGETRFNEAWLDQPLRWRRPRRIFVCAHGDLFHESVPDAWIDKVFAVMALAPWHTFQVLTKRAGRMRAYLDAVGADYDEFALFRWADAGGRLCEDGDRGFVSIMNAGWPLPNVWLGVSAEDQTRADERIPDLLATPAAIHFLSCEPLLGPLIVPRYIRLHRDLRGDFPVGHHTFAKAGLHRVERNCHGARSIVAENGRKLGVKPHECEDVDIGWAIAGGESGPGARPMHPDWPRALRDQCQAANVPFFFKQWGEWGPDDGPPGDGRDAIMDGRARCAVWHGNRWSHHVDGYAPGPNDGIGEWVYRVGKKAAGRLLDGREWNDLPAPTLSSPGLTRGPRPADIEEPAR